ncbi:MAG: putative zinc-binding metallopeptidase [Spongiibacteraceae bacterium]
MKSFVCDCGQSNYLFFDSVICNACGKLVGYCPDSGVMAAFSPNTSEGVWQSTALPGLYSQCQNYAQHQVCNWMVPVEDSNPLCRACRLNEMIPDLSQPENLEYWRKIEIAKRRCLYGILALDLPLVSKQEDPEHGLAYRFLTDRLPTTEFTQRLEGQQPVFTGHDDGVITINLAEADDIARTRTRVQLGETYRTLLGHFRHEIGHYYWQRLVAESPEHLSAFRQCFGDERVDYEQAKARHYEAAQGGVAQDEAAQDETAAPATQTAQTNWADDFISPYAAMHPWEDWAECWAHYLHMVDTLETAQSYALVIRGHAIPAIQPCADDADVGEWLQDWIRLSVALNSLNRSMGKSDPYPFVLTAPVQEKLRFIDRIVATAHR